MIAYDATRQSLFHPEQGATLLRAGQNYSDVQLAAECARLAYLRHEEDEVQLQRLRDAMAAAGFTRLQVFTDRATDSEAFAALRERDGLCIVAFRGTEPDRLRSILADARFLLQQAEPFVGKVHRGFAGCARAILPPLQEWLAAQQVPAHKLIVSGHSLGAALAVLAAARWRPTLTVTLGAPRVGDAVFNTSLSGLEILRFVNCSDLVTDLPPPLGYAHAGKLQYIDHRGTLLGDVAAATILRDRAIGLLRYAAGPMWQRGTLFMRGLADHAPINYLRALF